MSAFILKLKSQDGFAIIFLIAWHLVYFFPVALAQQVWFTADIVRLFYPFGVEYSRALSEGRLPLWSPNLLAGFPLLAETQVAALYPLNLLLYKILPAYYAISYSNLLHFAWAACGMYVLARSLNMRMPSALLAGFIFSFNGFIFGHLSHPTVIAAIAWLPWLIFLQSRLLGALTGNTGSAGIWLLLTTLVFGIQFLSGSIQIAFLNTLAFIAIGGASALFFQPELGWRARIRAALLTLAVPLIVGAGLAAVQLAPTLELIGLTVRSGASESFVASYSLPLDFLPQFLLPFIQGEPSEATGEYWIYFGFAPFALMLCAPFLRRDRRTIFYFAFALVAFSLALGELNPIYPILSRLPPFNLFRVPARYLLLFVFAAALLGAFALDELSNRLASGGRAARWVVAFSILTVALIALAYTQPLEFWLQAWQVASLPLALLTLAVIALAARKKIARETFASIVVGLTITSLAAYAPPFLATIDSLSPLSVVLPAPRSLAALQSPPAAGRAYTDLSVYPSLPALRGSLFPNVGMIFGQQSAQAYTSLSFARHEAYFTSLTPAMLDLLNARYYLVPLEPRPETKSVTPDDSLALDLAREEITIRPTVASSIEMTSFTEQAKDLADGTVVAELTVWSSDGAEARFPLRVGVDTADWDYDRKPGIKHREPPLARSFPAFWRSFGKAFDGHTYLTRLSFPDGKAQSITGVKLASTNPSARFTIEQIRLVDGSVKTSLAALAGKNNFALAYLSDTVAIWENQDSLPRAFIAHAAEIMNDDASFERLQDRAFSPSVVALLSEGDALTPRAGASAANDRVEIKEYAPERIALVVQSDAPGYLVLADSWYPGWQASVDGKPAPTYRAEVLFRAVPIEPGQHTVVFEYQPLSFRLGALISAASLAVAIGIAIVLGRRFKRL